MFAITVLFFLLWFVAGQYYWWVLAFAIAAGLLRLDEDVLYSWLFFIGIAGGIAFLVAKYLFHFEM